MRCSSLLVAALLVPFASCSFDGSNSNAFGDEGGDGSDGFSGGNGDGGVGGPDATPGCSTFSSHVDTCAFESVTGNLNLEIPGRYRYDTTNGTLRDPNDDVVPHKNLVINAVEGDFIAIITNAFVLGSNSQLEAEGDLPLAVLAVTNIEIAGTIDVSQGGAGAKRDCGESQGKVGSNQNGGAGGGGGGGFQGPGGNGGQGDADGATPSAPGPGGIAAPFPMSPLGGCRGGKGGEGEDPGGDGGDGGGAIYLASKTSITVSGGIHAGGEGGDGGQEDGGGNADAGGGGGGSGGYILLEAATVSVTGVLAANGGGGGEGSGAGNEGDDGDDASLADQAAPGGSSTQSTGTNGGAGSAGATLAGENVGAIGNGAGGGGGGGAGFIFVLPAQNFGGTGGTVSPPAL